MLNLKFLSSHIHPLVSPTSPLRTGEVFSRLSPHLCSVFLSKFFGLNIDPSRRHNRGSLCFQIFDIRLVCPGHNTLTTNNMRKTTQHTLNVLSLLLTFNDTIHRPKPLFCHWNQNIMKLIHTETFCDMCHICPFLM